MDLPILVKEPWLGPQKALEQLWDQGRGQEFPDFGLMMDRDVKGQEQGEPWLIDFG